jgi:hypothetical protein
MSSFQYRELLTKRQVFKKEPTTSTEEPKRHAYRESDGIYHEKVLLHFACGWQRCMLLKLQAALSLASAMGHKYPF